MCTLTLMRCENATGPALRVECNRDESRLRPPARSPEVRTAGHRRIVMPVDPVSDGTWIGANDAPLVAVLINVYARSLTRDELIALAQRDPPPPSRGRIVPHVLAGGTVDEALARAQQLDLKRYDPFRLVVADAGRYVHLLWSGDNLTVDPIADFAQPLFFTSSALGDEVVADPRRELFDHSFFGSACDPAAQDGFHRHVWPGREFASVWMTRPEARTVSITTVELDAHGARMTYEARAAENPETAELTPAESVSLDASSRH